MGVIRTNTFTKGAILVAQKCILNDDTDFLDLFPNCLSHPIPWTIGLSILHGLMFFLGLFLNSVVIFIILRTPRLRRNMRHVLMCNLAIADWVMIMATLPTNLLTATIRPWILGATLCKDMSYIQDVSIFASMYFIVAISFHRCLDITTPFLHPRLALPKWKIGLMICLIWILAFTIYLPWPAAIPETVIGQDGLPQCKNLWKSDVLDKIYFVVVFLVLRFIFPLILIITCQYITYKGLMNATALCCCSNSTGIRERRQKRNWKAVKTMMALTSIFCLCWLPLTGILFYKKFIPSYELDRNTIEILIPFARLIGALNSCVNPLLYAFMNKDVYKAVTNCIPILNKICGCCRISTRVSENVFFSSRFASGGNRSPWSVRIHRFNYSVPINLRIASTGSIHEISRGSQRNYLDGKKSKCRSGARKSSASI